MFKNILITGSNGGFGKLTVKSLLTKGYNVVATMRNVQSKNKAAADELTQLGAKVVEIDVTNDDSVNNGVQEAINLLGNIDVVINNAGVGVAGMQEHFTVDDFKRLFDINLFGVQRVNRAVLPHLRENKKGLIVYVSSLLGRITIPFYGPYNASKWALEALAENYRVELAPFGIESAIVEPGGYPTTFLTNLMTPSDSSRNESYGDFMNAPAQMGEAFGKVLQSNPQQNPQDVADTIVNLIETPKSERKFRTTVDKIGMGTPVEAYNTELEKITVGTLTNFGMGDLLK